MSKLMSEQSVLRKLGIKDFRHLTKAKVIKLASMLDKMDPEVAKKALEQFPEFSKTLKEMLSQYKDTLDKGLLANSDSVQNYYNVCNSIIESLKKQLENENLSFDDKKYIIDQMVEISKMVGEKDSENKKFIFTIAMVGAAATTLISAILATALGGNTNAEISDSDSMDNSLDDKENSDKDYIDNSLYTDENT